MVTGVGLALIFEYSLEPLLCQASRRRRHASAKQPLFVWREDSLFHFLRPLFGEGLVDHDQVTTIVMPNDTTEPGSTYDVL
jgi:hypothetical protein